MDIEFTKWLVTLGVGGVLAGFMFVFYRKDVKQYTELWRATAEQLMNVIKENTQSNTKLIALIEEERRNMMRKSDIEQLLVGQRHIMDSQDRTERR
jgi:hypothetical protein